MSSGDGEIRLDASLKTAETAAAYGNFQGVPEPSSLRALALALWRRAEAVGSVQSIDLKGTLLHIAMQHGISESEARPVLDACIPGPANYAAGRQPSEWRPEPLDSSRAALACRRCGCEFTARYSGQTCSECGGELRPPATSFAELPLPISTLDTVPEATIASVYGLVAGNTIRTRSVFGKFASGVQSTFGGELTLYTQLLTDSRLEAAARMVEDAMRLGADAVVGVRFVTSEVFESAVEVLAFGTAVQLGDSSA